VFPAASNAATSAAAPPGQLAFARDGDIYTSAANGTNIRRLTHLGNAGAPRWSADGRHLVFNVGNRATLSMSVWMMNADGRQQRRLRTGFDASWRPDGKALAMLFSPQGGCFIEDFVPILVTLANPTKVARCYNGEDVDAYDHPEIPDWAPDGQSFLTLNTNGGGGSGGGESIVRINATTGHRTELYGSYCDYETSPGPTACDPPLQPFQPRFSSDGKKIVFRGILGDYGDIPANVYVVPTNGKKPVRLGPDTDIFGPTFTRDNRSILYTVRASDGSVSIRKLSLADPEHPTTLLQNATGVDQRR
jgi:Tol biopolymer transport system component